MEQPSTALDAAFNNDNPEHRQVLITALRERGLEAYEYGSGGGWQHVCVYLVEEESDWLAVATGNMETDCEIGLMGDRVEAQVGDDFSLKPKNLNEAVAAFLQYCGEREHWISEYRQGKLDYL